MAEKMEGQQNLEEKMEGQQNLEEKMAEKMEERTDYE
jgi:hypothetical protein